MLVIIEACGAVDVGGRRVFLMDASIEEFSC
jgi:hypothetical protein